MPLFHHDTTSTASPSSSTRRSRHDTSPVAPTESRRTGLFGSRHSTSPSTHSTTSSTTNMKSSHGSLLHRNRGEDPSISAAREQVVLAETAERDADRALVAARQAVRDAREHVKRLEREAKEEARLAKIKQDQAATISKRAKPLGSKSILVLSSLGGWC